MSILALDRAAERFVVGYQRMNQIKEVNVLRVKIIGIYERLDIPDDVYKTTGFNVINAEIGFYVNVKLRYEDFQVFNDTLLKRTDTQGGTSVASSHRFDNWGVPLIPNHHCDPPEILPDLNGRTDTMPFWSRDVYIPTRVQAKTIRDGDGSDYSTKVDPEPEPKSKQRKCLLHRRHTGELLRLHLRRRDQCLRPSHLNG